MQNGNSTRPFATHVINVHTCSFCYVNHNQIVEFIIFRFLQSIGKWLIQSDSGGFNKKLADFSACMGITQIFFVDHVINV